MRNAIVSVPDHCMFIYIGYVHFSSVQCEIVQSVNKVGKHSTIAYNFRSNIHLMFKELLCLRRKFSLKHPVS